MAKPTKDDISPKVFSVCFDIGRTAIPADLFFLIGERINNLAINYELKKVKSDTIYEVRAKRIGFVIRPDYPKKVFFVTKMK